MASVYFPSGLKPVISEQTTPRRRVVKFNPPGPGTYAAPSSFAIIQDKRNAVGTKLGKEGLSNKLGRPAEVKQSFANVGPGKYDMPSSLSLLASPRNNPGTKVMRDMSGMSTSAGYRDANAKPSRPANAQDLTQTPGPAHGYYTNENWTSFSGLKGKHQYPGICRARAVSCGSCSPTSAAKTQSKLNAF